MPRFANNIGTLDPLRLGPSDIVTLSGNLTAIWDRENLLRRTEPTRSGSLWKFPAHTPECRRSHGASTVLYYGIVGASKGEVRPFPPGTKGWLYYHRPPSRPLISGVIRFRLVPSTHEYDFSSGTDLHFHSGLPFSIHMIQIATEPNYRMLANVLLRDKLVSLDVLERCATCKKDLAMQVFRCEKKQILRVWRTPSYSTLPGQSFYFILRLMRIYSAVP